MGTPNSFVINPKGPPKSLDKESASSHIQNASRFSRYIPCLRGIGLSGCEGCEGLGP